MSFSRPKFTNAGRNLQLRSIGGTEICFTKMKIGSGEITEGQDFREFTDLIDPKATLSLTGIAIEDGYARVKGYFSNSGLEAFNYRELGLFAKDPDNPNNEILYCYANYGEDYAYIADPGSEIIERSVTIVAIVDDALNVTAVLDSSAVYVDQDDLDEAIALHNSDPYAHPDLIGNTGVADAYIYPPSQEDADVRDGSEDHPFKYVGEALDAFPATEVATLRIHIYEGCTAAKDDDDYYVARIAEYSNVNIDSYGNTDPVGRAYINFFPAFINCETVHVDKLGIAFDSNPNYSSGTSYGPSMFHCENCTIVKIGDVTDENSTHTPSAWADFKQCGLVEFLKTTFTGLPTIGVLAEDTELIRIGKDVVIPSSMAKGFQLSNSCLICLASNSATVPVTLSTTSLYIDKATVEKISDGTVKNHLTLTNNPHNVTLAQAMSAGGTVNVAHGGTGRTTLTSGAVLLGNGSNAVGMKTGTGAFYASTSGDPKFGTLPIAQGGTGRTDNGTFKNSTGDINNTASRGYIEFPGASGSKVLIQWGRCYVSAGGSGTYQQTFSKQFANTNYILIPTTSNWGHTEFTTKAKTGFTLTLTLNNAILAHTTDDSFEWIAIGFC